MLVKLKIKDKLNKEKLLLGLKEIELSFRVVFYCNFRQTVRRSHIIKQIDCNFFVCKGQDYIILRNPAKNNDYNRSRLSRK